MGKLSFDAVIFDLDGVVTKTAFLHADSWKIVLNEYLMSRQEKYGEPFKEFSHENDYRAYLDGKPRYDGVKSFLGSRGIELPFGSPGDVPGRETVCGLGNRKNEKFGELLETKGVEAYPTSVEFIRNLRERNIRVGVASSSKNCKFVIKSAGIEDLFDSVVDGGISSEIGLKGKPEGDIFVKVASELGTHPSRTVVVEDANSGVQAGRNGAFGLVIGVAREGNAPELLANGADIAVRDLGDIDEERMERWFQEKPVFLFEAWYTQPGRGDVPASAFPTGYGEKISLNPRYLKTGKESVIGGKKPVFFFDYDGTLTPIVDRPELAIISEEMRSTVRGIAGAYPVAIISGRNRRDVENFVGIDGIFYVGNHGFDIKGPSVEMIHPEAELSAGLIEDITRKLKEDLKNIPQVLIEEKRFSTAVHYRLVEANYVPEIRDRMDRVIRGNEKLRVLYGKKVFEIMPTINWDKGKAVRWIMGAMGVSWDGVNVIYAGDDTTDEDAFRMIRTRGIGILVAERNRPSAAGFWVVSPGDLKKMLTEILKG